MIAEKSLPNIGFLHHCSRLPPMVQPFDPTASKPLMLLTVSSEEKSGKELYDLAYYSLRQMLSGVKGIIAPAAYGGAL